MRTRRGAEEDGMGQARKGGGGRGGQDMVEGRRRERERKGKRPRGMIKEALVGLGRQRQQV